MELNGGGYACSGELSTAKSDFFREKRVISAAAPWRSEPCSLSVLCTHVHISACMVCVCVCVRGYIQAEEPQAEPGEHKLSLGFVRDETGRGQ